MGLQLIETLRDFLTRDENERLQANHRRGPAWRVRWFRSRRTAPRDWNEQAYNEQLEASERER